MDLFNKFSKKAGDIIGSSWAFSLAFLFIIVWLVTGPFFNFSDTWQLIINTSTTIVTFLIAFLLQHSQNRDTKMIQLKLDELILVIKRAKNSRIALDELSDEQLKSLEENYKRVAKIKERSTKTDKS